MTGEQLEASVSLSLPIRCFILSIFHPYSFFIALPSSFESYLLHSYLDLNLFSHHIWECKESYISSFLYLLETSGVRIFFEDEQEIPDFHVSFTFEELLTLALELTKIFFSKLADINKLFINFQLKEKLQPDLFITQLSWNTISFLSPELFTAYLNLKSQFEQEKILLESKQAVFQAGCHQISIKTYSVQLDFNFLIDILIDIWLNVFEYVDAYLKAPWIIIPP